MFRWLQKWWHQRIIRRSKIKNAEWSYAFSTINVLNRLTEQEQTKLKQLAILFLYYKALEGVGDIEINDTLRVTIALQACLPILNLGLNWFDGWVSVIVYPGAYSKESSEKDEYGIVHQGRAHLSGESWQRGPVILSWNDVVRHRTSEGNNLVIHEFAHKLDMLNGSANGHPPLHHGMSVQRWSEVFNRAYTDFNMRIQYDEYFPIDNYAATSPAEFFSVFSEYFFENPVLVMQYYPEVYQLLAQFYRQDPFLHFKH